MIDLLLLPYTTFSAESNKKKLLCFWISLTGVELKSEYPNSTAKCSPFDILMINISAKKSSFTHVDTLKIASRVKIGRTDGCQLLKL